MRPALASELAATSAASAPAATWLERLRETWHQSPERHEALEAVLRRMLRPEAPPPAPPTDLPPR